MLDWQILNEQEWEAAQSVTPQPPALQRTYWRQFAWGATGVLLVAIVGALYFMWQEPNAKMRQSEADVLGTISSENAASRGGNDAVAAPLTDEQAPERWVQTQRDQDRLLALTTDGEASVAAIELENLDVQGDWATAQVVVVQPTVKVPQLAYRQTWFYYHHAKGWLRTTPVASLWGPGQSTATKHVTFRFQKKDQHVIATVAAHVDELYASLRQDFGLPPADPNDQLTVEVAFTAKSSQFIDSDFWDNKITVPSPALLAVSTELSEADVLVQYIVTALLTYLTDARVRRAPVLGQWAHMVVALRRWQLWRHNEALTAWHHQMTTWLYSSALAGSAGLPTSLLEEFDHMCQKAEILEASVPPGATALSLWCKSADAAQLMSDMAKPAVYLNDLIAPNASWQSQEHGIRAGEGYGLLGWYHYLPLETVIDYAVITHGRDRLPVLLEAMGHHDTWQTLIPAVFGVSADEFERGWQAYLQTRYQSPN